MARVVFIKFAQQIVIVRFSACAVPARFLRERNTEQVTSSE